MTTTSGKRSKRKRSATRRSTSPCSAQIRRGTAIRKDSTKDLVGFTSRLFKKLELKRRELAINGHLGCSCKYGPHRGLIAVLSRLRYSHGLDTTRLIGCHGKPHW